MTGKVLVTLTTDDYQCDYELPSSVELSELYPRLLEVLKRESAIAFGGWEKLFLCSDDGALRAENATLDDYGICSGYTLKVIREV